jgi:hypothetical protein
MSGKITQRKVEKEIRKHFKEFSEWMIKKNRAYGNSAFYNLNIFGSGTSENIIKIRMDDKLNKMIKGKDLSEEKDDAAKDFCGYWHLLQVVTELNKEVKHD